MRKKLSPPDLALYRAVDEVLHYVWDPIGVSPVPRARDEHHGYLPQVFSMLRNGPDKRAIAAYLGKVSTDSMGLSANAKHDLRVAQILIDWKEAIGA
jgi:hypothetical protein